MKFVEILIDPHETFSKFGPRVLHGTVTDAHWLFHESHMRRAYLVPEIQEGLEHEVFVRVQNAIRKCNLETIMGIIYKNNYIYMYKLPLHAHEHLTFHPLNELYFGGK